MKTDAIIIRFKMIGAAAGAANFPREFKMPDWKETMEINSRNGKVIRERVVVSSSFPGSSAKPGASSRTTPGIKISITITKRVTKNVRAENSLRCKIEGVFPLFADQFVGKHWYECGGKSSFGKQAAEQVGDFERGQKSVRNRSGSQIVGQDHIAEKAGYPADKCKTAESGDRFK